MDDATEKVKTTPGKNAETDMLDGLRLKLLNASLWVIFGDSIFIGVISYLSNDQNFLYLISAVIVMGVICFVKRLGRNIRFATMIVILYLVGALELKAWGTTGVSLFLFIMVVFFSSVLVGKRAAIVALVLCQTTMIAFAYLHIQGAIEIAPYRAEVSDNWHDWFHIPFNLLLGGCVIIISVDYLLTRLQTSLVQAHDLVEQLQVSVGERDHAESELDKSREQYKILADNVHDVVWMLDMNFNPTYISPSMFAQRGFTAEEALSKSIDDDVAPEYVPLLMEAFRSELQIESKGSANLNRSATLEYEVLKKDGSLIWVESVMTFLRDKEGTPTHIIGSTRDISSRKNAEKEKNALQLQIQQTQKLESLGVMAGGIAHDFNNLLLGVIGNADIALLNMKPEEKNYQYLTDIMASAHRAADLCSQLLAYSGKGRFVVQPIDLSELVYEMTQLLEISINKKVGVEYMIEKNLPAIEADVTQMQQIIMNLVINASDAIGEDAGVITITIEKQYFEKEHIHSVLNIEDLNSGDYVVFECSDDGSGMDEFTKERIFDPFYSTKGLGHGLGLAAVVGIVQGHGGGVNVTSEVGKGTSIKIILPVSDQKAVSIKFNPRSDVEMAGTGTILIVDDDAMILAFAKQALEKVGYNVLVAENGKIALEMREKHRDEIDLVLLDMTMPVMDGKETYQKLNELDPKLKVIVSSGYNEEETISHFTGNGTVRFIQKPYRVGALQALVSQALEEPQEL